MKRRQAVLPAPSTRLLFLGLALSGLTACEGLDRSTGTVRAGSLNVPRAVAHAPRLGPIDVEHYALDIEVIPETRRIDGTCTVRLSPIGRAIDTVELDFEGLDTYGVLDERGRSLAHSHVDGVLTVQLTDTLEPGDTADLIVRYGGSPKKGLWFVGADTPGGTPDHVFTQGECEDSRWWFPCWDVPSDRATSEVKVTMPAHWQSVAAGEMLGRTTEGRKATEHWSMDFAHPTYLLTLVAGDLVKQDDEWEDVPLSYLAPPEYADWLEAGFDETGEALTFLSEITGRRYPYAKYSQACVEEFPFGGMENISATTMTTSMLRDERGLLDYSSTGLVVHEAAHQWFGDLMTCADWSHIWLNEGFATYMTLLYFERTRGVDDFRIRMRNTQESYLEGDVGDKRRPIVHNVYKDPIDLFFGGQAYPGGASRLHLLRFLLGDEDFFAGVRTYVAENEGRGVVTDDLRRALEKASGEKLGWFFDQWLLEPGFPEFAVDWKWDERKQVVELRVTQRQDFTDGTPRAFRTPVEVEVRDARGITVHRLEINDREERYVLAASGRPVWVRFDKHGWIPKRLESRKDGAEWLAILAGDDDVNGRRDAAKALGKLAQKTTDFEKQELYVAELVDRLRKDKVAGVRQAAAEALGVAGGLEARARLMTAAAEDVEVDVRKAAMKSLQGWGKDRDIAQLAREVFASRYSWDTMAAAAGLYATAEPEGAFDYLVRALLVDSPHDTLRAEVIAHLGKLDHPEVVDQLIGWARDESAGSRARQAAAKELGKSHRGGSRASQALRDLVSTRDFRLRGAVLEALSERGDLISRRAIEAYYGQSVYPREKRTMEAALRTYSPN